MTDPDDLVRAAYAPAAALACAVHDNDPNAVNQALAGITDTRPLLIALADLVQVDQEPPPRREGENIPCLSTRRARQLAAITGEPDPWFPQDRTNAKCRAYARIVCHGCTRRVECAAQAAVTPGLRDEGVKAGLTESDRRALRKAHALPTDGRQKGNA